MLVQNVGAWCSCIVYKVCIVLLQNWVHGAAAKCWCMLLLHGVRGAATELVAWCCCKVCVVLLQNWLRGAVVLLQGVLGAAAELVARCYCAAARCAWCCCKMLEHGAAAWCVWCWCTVLVHGESVLLQDVLGAAAELVAQCCWAAARCAWCCCKVLVHGAAAWCARCAWCWCRIGCMVLLCCCNVCMVLLQNW